MGSFPYEIHPLLILSPLDVIYKNSDNFGIWPPSGDIDSEEFSYHGLYWRGMRFLSRWTCRVLDLRPVPLIEQGRRDPFCDRIHRVLPVLTYFDPKFPKKPRLVVRLSLTQTRVLDASGFLESFVLENRSPFQVTVPLSWGTGCNFDDMFEVRGFPRRSNVLRAVEWAGSGKNSEYLYRGEDGRVRATRISVSGPHPASVNKEGWEWNLSLPPGGEAPFEFRVRFSEWKAAHVAKKKELPLKQGTIDGTIRRLKNDYLHFQGRWPEISTSDPFFDRCFRQAVQDLRILCTPSREGLVPYAGLPWFATVFGRDALITGLSTLWAFPDLSRSILLLLGRCQAQRKDPKRAAEPGKIIHEMRSGEMANTGEIPFGRYYGSVDSTPLYLVLAAQYTLRTGDLAFLDRLWPVIERAFKWIEDFGTDPRTGFVVYRGDTDGGLVQQGWKDSEDSVFHADGRIAPHPIALSEVQSYLHWAYTAFGRLAPRIGRSRHGKTCQERANRLRKAFIAAFWLPSLRTFALAVDGNGNPCSVRTSNAGHVLLSGMVHPRMANTLGKSLLEEDLWSGWGIRTLGTREARFNPVSYHNGSVWPHDNAMILWGMSRHGLVRPLERLAGGFFDGLRFFRDQRPPELYCGFVRKEDEGPVAYPTSCSPQAWSVASVFMAIGALAGFRFDMGAFMTGLSGLPACLDSLSIRNIPVCGPEKAFVHYSIRRDGHKAMSSVTMSSTRADSDLSKKN